MSNAAGLTGVFIFLVAVYVAAVFPAFIIARRLDVAHPGEAFLPFVGANIVLLHSIRRSGWLCLIGLIPYVGIVFYIWLACVVPGAHGRSKWWILPFLIPGINLIAFYAYAFTLPQAPNRAKPAFAISSSWT